MLSGLNPIDTDWSALYIQNDSLAQSHPYSLATNPVLQATYAIQNAGYNDGNNILMHTLPTTYMYGIYHHAHSAHNVRLPDLESRAKQLECFYEI